jgi:hypothetical protein
MHDKSNLDQIKIHYIIGLGRSGTTLLLNELGKSVQVISNPESLFILDFLYVQDPKKMMSSKEVDSFLEQIFSLRTGRFVNLDMWKIDRNQLNEAIKKMHFVRFIDLIKLINLYSTFGLKTSEPLFILDKNPPYTLHVEQLNKLDDGSKFIGIYRSYLDNVISRNKYKLDAFNHPYYHALTWCRYNEELLKCHAKFEDSIQLIKYEEFVKNPDFYLSKARIFLGIPNELRTTKDSTLNELLKTLDSEKEKQQFLEMHGKTFNSIDDESIGKKNVPFSLNQINCIHAICSETSIKLGYEPVLFQKPQLNVRLQIRWFKLLVYFVERKHFLFYKSSHQTRKWFKYFLKPWTIFIQ